MVESFAHRRICLLRVPQSSASGTFQAPACFLLRGLDDRNGSGWIVLKKSGPAKVQVLLSDRRLPRVKEKNKKGEGSARGG